MFNWIFISSPIFQNLIFIPGFLYCALRSTRRFIKINNFSKYNDLWRSKNEKIDFIVFLTLVSFLMIFIIFNAPFYNGWRLVYFFNFFIVYFGLSFINILFLFFRKKRRNKIFIKLILLVSIFYNFYNLILFHPYQSIYFNNFLSKNYINGFEGDYYGLSSKHFFNKILEIDKRDKIKIAVASHTPLQRGLEAFPPKIQKRFNIVGQEYKSADYVYKNNISEVDLNHNKKYKIPQNFSKIFEFYKNKILIYEIYKRNK